MTPRIDWPSGKDLDKIPNDWTVERGKYGYHAKHSGVAMNRCQWQVPGHWTVDTVEQSGKVRAHFFRDFRPTGEQAPITIVGKTLTVTSGFQKVEPQPDETPLLAGVRWVKQQENAAQQLGSK